MANKVIIGGSEGGVADVRKFVEHHQDHYALEVATRPSREYVARSLFFRNEIYGLNLNQNASLGGSTDGIHDGTDTALWTASALGGTWTFNSTFSATGWPTNGTQSIDATATTNGDQALFTRSSAIDSGNYSAVSGKIYLSSFDDTRHSVLIFFRLAGVQVGTATDITNFVDSGSLNAAQQFVIPLSTLGVTGNIDEMVIQTVRTSGSQPDYYLDEISLSQSGSFVYTVEPQTGQTYEFDTVEFLMADALNTTLTDASMQNLSYDQILGVSQLPNGINLRLTIGGRILFSGTFRDLGDILIAAFTVESSGCDGTNTFLKLTAKLSSFVKLKADRRDKLEITISDDLSGLLRFRANVRGRLLLNGD